MIESWSSINKFGELFSLTNSRSWILRRTFGAIPHPPSPPPPKKMRVQPQSTGRNQKGYEKNCYRYISLIFIIMYLCNSFSCAISKWRICGGMQA